MAEGTKGGGLKLFDGLALVVVGVFGVVVAFWVLSSIAGFVWGLVKIAVLIAVVFLIFRLLVGRRR